MRLPALAGFGAVAFAVVALTGCSSTSSPASALPPSSVPSSAHAQAAPEAARVGAAGSGCELPVSFGLQASWRPQAVRVDAGDPLAGLARRGTLTMVCEIDAKPAGNIGYLRVYTGKTDDLRAALTAFAGTEAQNAVYTDLRIGGRPALEVTYQAKSQLEDALEPERAFVVQAGSKLVAVALDSFDSDEHAAMTPAFELARSSLTVP
ncbi:hypothetical protein JIG36_41235 [Actinoplanes sp. LDG1-06]|uniref:Lipoprotein n=1 Tax=Paractinoplanes ovalisporus TaxID=2810368 RepID=A0ABS2AQ22_9ACTN|nr:lipoprotein [Actinoplanes ovalisporus]MBM2621945.1 hypothetical protein [Actinoplanes ovalisporus]